MAVKFKLKSTKRENARTYECESIGPVADGSGSTKIYASVDPPIPAFEYATANDLDRIVLAPRHEGASLFPAISEWPCHVHICVPEKGGDWRLGPFQILDWAVIVR